MSQSLLAIFSSIIPKEVQVALASVIGLVFLDILLGILAAFVTNTFDPRKLPSFLKANLLPYVGSLMLLVVLSGFLREVKVLFFIAVTTVAAKFLLDFKDKLFKIVGLKAPDPQPGQDPIRTTVLQPDYTLADPSLIQTPAATKRVLRRSRHRFR